MKKLAICLVLLLLLVGIVNAQKSVTGTVIDYNSDWKTITIKVGNASYVIFTAASTGCRTSACKSSANYPAPKIVGNIKDNRRKVRVYYTKIIDEHGFGYILRGVSKIVEVK